MIRPLLAVFISIILVSDVTAQLRATPVKITDDLNRQNPTSFPQQSGAKGASCGVDTVYYPYNKTTAFQAVSLNTTTSGNAFSQWFPAPQPITVSGFDFFAWQSDGTNARVTVTCNLYLATSDSLPFGSPARSVTVTIDSTFGNGVISGLRKHAKFNIPITMSVPYVITVESSSSVNVSVLCNNYAAGNGRNEWLSSVRIQNNWIRSTGINVGGTIFNADFIFMPTVSYQLNADFTFSGCNEGNTNFQFTNTSSPIMQDRFYNRYAFFNIAQFGFQWNYGDGSGNSMSINGNKTYTQRLPYLVTLKDTMYGWTVGCSDVRSRMVPFTPPVPKIYNSGPHCSGDSAHLWADSIFTGVEYAWSGPKGFTSFQQNPSIGITDTSKGGLYRVSVRYAACQGGDTTTELVVYQTPQKPVASNNGPKCIGDDLTISASSPSPNINYHWSGPDGFIHNSDQHTFFSVDTTNVGTYFVYVDDANCVSDVDSTSIYTYPPPQIPLLESAVGDSICQGDTIYLIGNSVFGAQFEWTGPEGFMSNDTDPSFLASDTLQSGYYASRVVIGSCLSDWDSVFVHVKRRAITPTITGLDTSTENLVKIYNANKNPFDAFIWSCTGGTIESIDSANGEIAVRWGVPGTGNLTVVSYSEGLCYGETESITVQILALPPPVDTNTQNVQSFEGNAHLYPNPSKQSIAIHLPSGINEFDYRISGMDGKVIVTGRTRNQSTINIEQLIPGVYLLMVEANGQFFPLRLERLH